MVLMKLKVLESTLSNVEPFRNPKHSLEQYLTSPHIASHMLYYIEMNFRDIEGKTVVDLGCGTGMLSIAASLLGASYCLGLDIDDDALDIARENLDDVEITNVELLKVDVLQPYKLQKQQQQQQLLQQPEKQLLLQNDYINDNLKELKVKDSGTNFDDNDNSTTAATITTTATTTTNNNNNCRLFARKFDTVIMNPPFGTKDIQDADIDFVKFGLSICTGSVYSLHQTKHFLVIKKRFSKLKVQVEPVTQIKFDLPRSYKNHRRDSLDIEVQMLKFTRMV